MNSKKIKICFIRHGETIQNTLKRIQGIKDFPLNENGINQATLCGEYLKENNYHFDLIYSSPLIRAYKTAEIIKEVLSLDIPIIKDSSFIERNFGEYEGKEISKTLYKSILADIGSFEKSSTLKERAYNGLMKIIKENKAKSILIVSHSHTIKAILNKIDNIPFDYNLVNCSINNLEYENGNIKIKNLNIDYKKGVNLK